MLPLGWWKKRLSCVAKLCIWSTAGMSHYNQTKTIPWLRKALQGGITCKVNCSGWQKRQGANYHPITLFSVREKVLCLLSLILHWVFIYIHLISRTGLLKLLIITIFYFTGTWNLCNFTIFAFRCLTSWFFCIIGRAHFSKNTCFYKGRVELINHTTLFSQNLPFLGLSVCKDSVSVLISILHQVCVIVAYGSYCLVFWGYLAIRFLIPKGLTTSNVFN